MLLCHPQMGGSSAAEIAGQVVLIHARFEELGGSPSSLGVAAPAFCARSAAASPCHCKFGLPYFVGMIFRTLQGELTQFSPNNSISGPRA
jgi:hypothetical protein